MIGYWLDTSSVVCSDKSMINRSLSNFPHIVILHYNPYGKYCENGNYTNQAQLSAVFSVLSKLTGQLLGV